MRKLLLTAIAIFGMTVDARADVIQTFDLSWSGAAFNNSATATGTVTINETILANPSVGQMFVFLPDPSILGLSVTVSGASSGNGTFGLSDFGSLYWNTGGVSLDLSKDLVGQATATSIWGTSSGGAGGDFNLFGTNGAAPFGTWYFQLTTDGGVGDTMQLTSFTPEKTGASGTSVPEPASIALISAGLLALAGLRGRRKTA